MFIDYSSLSTHLLLTHPSVRTCLQGLFWSVKSYFLSQFFFHFLPPSIHRVPAGFAYACGDVAQESCFQQQKLDKRKASERA